MYIKILNYVLACIKNNKEFTIRIDNEGNLHQPLKGFIVSITPLINVGMDVVEMMRYVVSNGSVEIDGNSYKLYLGGWFDDNSDNMMTDVSVVIKSLEEAKQVGMHCGQKAVYDVSKKELVYL